MGQYFIKVSIHISENLSLFKCRAKYVPDGNGGFKIANICSFGRPVFNPDSLETVDFKKKADSLSEEPKDHAQNVHRATRRAREACFDYILCNDLNIFATLTFNQEFVNRSSYKEVYQKLGNWCSNLVQRKDFKYVAVPEYHKDGENIHFHMLSTGDGLNLLKSGHMRQKKPVYNIDNWKWGFSTAQYVTGENAREKCAKYIFKYMGKQMGQKIGGRYYLSGGALSRPQFVYADDPEELGDLSAALYHREVETEGGLYREWSFL